MNIKKLFLAAVRSISGVATYAQNAIANATLTGREQANVALASYPADDVMFRFGVLGH